VALSLKTVPTIRILLAGLALALSTIALVASIGNYRAMQQADRLAAAGRVLVALDKGTVEMSFERSLTQVGLSLPDAFGPPFSDLLLEQRRKSDAQLDGIAALSAGLTPAQASALGAAIEEQRRAIGDLRRDADARCRRRRWSAPRTRGPGSPRASSGMSCCCARPASSSRPTTAWFPSGPSR